MDCADDQGTELESELMQYEVNGIDKKYQVEARIRTCDFPHVNDLDVTF